MTDFALSDFRPAGQCKRCKATQFMVHRGPSKQVPRCGACVARDMLCFSRYTPTRGRKLAVVQFLRANDDPTLREMLATDDAGLTELRRRLHINRRKTLGPRPRHKAQLAGIKSAVVTRQRKAEGAPTTGPALNISRLGGFNVKLDTAKGCAWPIGSPREPDFRWCNALPLHVGRDRFGRRQKKPYCEHHAALAYVRQKL